MGPVLAGNRNHSLRFSLAPLSKGPACRAGVPSQTGKGVQRRAHGRGRVRRPRRKTPRHRCRPALFTAARARTSGALAESIARGSPSRVSAPRLAIAPSAGRDTRAIAVRSSDRERVPAPDAADVSVMSAFRLVGAPSALKLGAFGRSST